MLYEVITMGTYAFQRPSHLLQPLAQYPVDQGQDIGPCTACVITSYSIHYTKLYERLEACRVRSAVPTSRRHLLKNFRLLAETQGNDGQVPVDPQTPPILLADVV